MTCIIGLEHEGRIYMGADSSSISGWDRVETAIPKIFTLRSQSEEDHWAVKFLLGCAGSPRAAQILRYHLKVKPPHTVNVVEYLVTEFIEPARLALKDHGVAEVENAKEATGGSQFLLGYEGQLFLVDSDFQLTRFASGMAAVGVGANYALGAMLALTTRDPQKRILKALEITGKLCMGVCPPYQVEML